MNGLEKKILLPWFASALLISAVSTFLISLVLVWQEMFSFVTVSVLFVGLSVLGKFYMLLRYRNWGFEMRDDYLYLEHGVIKKVKTKVPYVRVQHVDTERGLVERVFGLSSVVVYTAGSRGADVGIPGLLPGDADGIQEELRKVAVESEEEFGDGV
jgi:membrane protein YdbS with pleckstrin-like domain